MKLLHDWLCSMNRDVNVINTIIPFGNYQSVCLIRKNLNFLLRSLCCTMKFTEMQSCTKNCFVIVKSKFAESTKTIHIKIQLILNWSKQRDELSTLNFFCYFLVFNKTDKMMQKWPINIFHMRKSRKVYISYRLLLLKCRLSLFQLLLSMRFACHSFSRLFTLH